MRIIKLGGSLYHTEYLSQWLNNIAKHRELPIVIVPGGSVFADQVRMTAEKYSLNDETAHRMALLAMQQFGELLCGLHSTYTTAASIEQFKEIARQKRIPVWAPFTDAERLFEWPRNWDSTSDALALWLAIKQQATHLCLIKSADFTVSESIKDLVLKGILDNQFGQSYTQYNGEIMLFGKHEVERFGEAME